MKQINQSIAIASLIAMLFLPLNQLFAQTIITDRPDQTESSSTVPLAGLQIESGILLGYAQSSSIQERQILAPTTLFRFGLTKGIEIRILSQFESIQNQLNTKTIDGISDLELGTKIQLLKNSEINTEIALLSHLIIPTGSEKLSLDHYGTINKLCISHALNDHLGLGYNIGYNYFGTGKGDLTYTIALGFAVNERVGIYIEPYGDLVEFEEHVFNFDAGFTYLLSTNTQLDFSFGTGINHTMNYLSVGISTQLLRTSSNSVSMKF